MASPRTVTIVALSVALGLFFVFMGTIKLTPRLSKDAYNEMVSCTAVMGDILLPGGPAIAAAFWLFLCKGISHEKKQAGERERMLTGKRAAASRLKLPLLLLRPTFSADRMRLIRFAQFYSNQCCAPFWTYACVHMREKEALCRIPSVTNAMFLLFCLQKRAYKSYVRALPMLKRMGISSIILRKSIGALEVACGIVMTLVPGRPKDVANFLLLLLVLAVLFFHQLVGDPLKRYAHALVFGILLTCRLLIARQPEDQPPEKRTLSVNGEEQPLLAGGEPEKGKMKVS
ncbi:hypothetical protein JD844_004468 [Phrynosoma platyrhinos]|uniref:Novel acetylcholine receptor chaperone n=1 Tax=Phrynosoma platyrhinos TaxID=52577 RepID=A0ABQ7TN48_PHRPL|nr:hypothetical protein JD844_004468 [Phrynosoma platyrhinos]